MTAISFEDLINLEREAVEAYDEARRVEYSAAAWKPWLDAAAVFQAAVTSYAKQEGKDRVSVEMGVKKMVRQPATADRPA